MKNNYLVLFIVVSCLQTMFSQQKNTSNYIKSTTYLQGVTTNPAGAKKSVSVVYFDGLGRETQSVQVGASPTKKSIVKHTEYDLNIGKTKEYLPYTTSSGSADFISNAKSQTLAFYKTEKYENTNNPYTQNVYENSPLKRVIQTANPGESWKVNGGHTTDYTYRFNTATEVKYSFAVASLNSATGLYNFEIKGTGNYPVNTLRVVRVSDPDGNISEEFTDIEQRIVLKRVYENAAGTGAGVDTYYIYDQYGNLTMVTSPLLNGNTVLSAVDLLGYQYKYDAQNRLAAKKLPGKAWEFMVYDKKDRIIAQGPVLHPLGNGSQGWIINKYDGLSRVVYTSFYSGITANETGRKTFQTNVDNSAVGFEKKSTPITIDGVSVPYTNLSFPKDGLTILSINYYDEYNFTDAPSSFPAIEGQTVQQNIKGLLAGSWKRVLTTASERKGELTYFLYDYKGQILRNYSKNYLGGRTQIDTKYGFAGNVEVVRTKHSRLATSTDISIEENFVYDHQNRLLYQTHKVGNLAEVVIAENIYDELGALQTKRVGGKRSGTATTANTFLQEINYKYNIRGWLTQVNDVSNLDITTNGKTSLFALKLNYNKIEQGIAGTTGLYNGNITEQIYRSSLDNKKRGYSYVYDRLNRLTLAALKTPDLAISGNDTPYGEKLTYDKNGNILKLTRNGAPVANKVTQIDNLTYSYEPGSNKLSKVVDASGNLEGFKKGNTTTSPDYTYDVFGNLTVDRNKNITKISYNSLHLPVELNIGSDKITYLYDASGKKVQKKVTQGTSTTDYLNGFQYVNNVLSFIPTSEGFFDFKTNKYVYQYVDQLGNVRLSYSDKDGNNKIETAEIIEQINYYPFGLAHKGYNQKNDPLMKDFKYQYNGKENQEELGLNVYDYGARNYDAAIGRWMNVDPLAEKMPNYNPYTYTFNNPVNFIDPTGMIPEESMIKDDIIINNNSGDEIARIILPGDDVKVILNTDISLSDPLVIDPSKEQSIRQETIDAIGVNVGYSATVGGGMEGGLSVMYFINGPDEGTMAVYPFVGGNVGLGGGLGVEGVVSHFNRSLSTIDGFGVDGFTGGYNGYSFQTPIGGYSMSWSNTKGTTDEIFPAHRSPTMWTNFGFSQKGKFEGKFSGGEFKKPIAKYNFNKK